MMIGLLLASLLAGQTAPAPAPAAADPLAPAREGRLRCLSPNAAKRTCASITQYKVQTDGSFDAKVTGIVSRNPQVLIQYSTFGFVENGAVCTMIRARDFETAKLLSNGLPLTGAADRDMRLELQGSVQPLAGKKRCYQDRADEGGDLRAMVTLDGVAQPQLSQAVTWVLPGDGYAVGI